MSKHKQHKRPTRWRGRPVKPKRAPRGRGRGPLPADPDLAIVSPDMTVRTQVPSTIEERDTWRDAAAIEERKLGLAAGALTVGPWLRRAANAEARRIIDSAELHARAVRGAFAEVKP